MQCRHGPECAFPMVERSSVLRPDSHPTADGLSTSTSLSWMSRLSAKKMPTARRSAGRVKPTGSGGDLVGFTPVRPSAAVERWAMLVLPVGASGTHHLSPGVVELLRAP